MNIVVIINPASRRARQRSVWQTVRRKFSDCGHRIVPTGYPGHATELARQAVSEGADVLVAVGGDGTVNQLLNGMVGSGCALGVIPAGTANDLASQLGLPTDTARACDIVLNGHTRAIDVIRVNHRHYLTTVGLGLPCEVLQAVDRFRTKTALARRLAAAVGGSIYLCGLLRALAARRSPGRLNLSFDQRNLEAEPLSLTLSNLPVLGPGFSLAPQAQCDDGRFDLCLIENAGPLETLLTVISARRGNLGARPSVRSFRTDQVVLHSERPVLFFGDGELIAPATEFDIKLLPRAVRLTVPVSPEGS